MIPPKYHAGGFTLIELLVSMAIGSILLLAAVSLLGSSGDNYERIGGGVAAEREARAVITQLNSDLSTAIFHKDGILEKSSTAWSSDRIGFLSLQPAQAQTDEGRIGDLCAVNYYIKDLSIGGKNVRCLMRGFRESATTIDKNGNPKTGAFDALRALIDIENPDPDAVTRLFDPLDGIDEPVAFGVVSFEARPKSRDASGKWIDWIPNATNGPEALETRLVIARRSLAGRLKTTADWNESPLLGKPAEPDRNKNLEIFGAITRFGNHENP